jgi:CheY-like chemotaxis protein
MAPAYHRRDSRFRSLDLARVLLIEADVASRLTLQTLLHAGGYAVDVAASAAEAYSMLDDGAYELVISDEDMESPDAGRGVLAYARGKEYKPATALVTAHRDGKGATSWEDRHMVVETNDASYVLEKVAELIGVRAFRRAERAARQ